jgi:hypothetical protein
MRMRADYHVETNRNSPVLDRQTRARLERRRKNMRHDVAPPLDWRRPMRLPVALACCLTWTVAATARAEAPRSRVVTSSEVTAEMDGCLDHSVRELGMSAKREGEARSWRIGPQFLHPTVAPEGTLQVRFEKAPTRTKIVVDATWPGALKADDVQREIESRLRAMAEKLAQVCGVTKPAVECVATPAGGAAKACPKPAQP